MAGGDKSAASQPPAGTPAGGQLALTFTAAFPSSAQPAALNLSALLQTNAAVLLQPVAIKHGAIQISGAASEPRTSKIYVHPPHHIKCQCEQKDVAMETDSMILIVTGTGLISTSFCQNVVLRSQLCAGVLVTQKATDTQSAIESYAGPVTAPSPDVATSSGTNPYPVPPLDTRLSP